MAETRFFGAVNFTKYQNFRGKRAHWMKLSLDFFDDPVVLSLPDSQRLAFIAVLILCGKRSNRVPFSSTYIKKRCSLRVTPDLDLFLAHGLIEITCPDVKAEVFPRGEESREEEREENVAHDAPAYVPPPDVRAETAIREGTVALERKLLRAVALLADRIKPERDALSIMREVTAYRKPDGSVVPGRMNPSGLSAERLEKSLSDAEGWLADLDKQQASA